MALLRKNSTFVRQAGKLVRNTPGCSCCGNGIPDGQIPTDLTKWPRGLLVANPCPGARPYAGGRVLVDSSQLTDNPPFFCTTLRPSAVAGCYQISTQSVLAGAPQPGDIVTGFPTESKSCCECRVEDCSTQSVIVYNGDVLKIKQFGLNPNTTPPGVGSFAKCCCGNPMQYAYFAATVDTRWNYDPSNGVWNKHETRQLWNGTFRSDDAYGVSLVHYTRVIDGLTTDDYDLQVQYSACSPFGMGQLSVNFGNGSYPSVEGTDFVDTGVLADSITNAGTVLRACRSYQGTFTYTAVPVFDDGSGSPKYGPPNVSTITVNSTMKDLGTTGCGQGCQGAPASPGKPPSAYILGGGR